MNISSLVCPNCFAPIQSILVKGNAIIKCTHCECLLVVDNEQKVSLSTNNGSHVAASNVPEEINVHLAKKLRDLLQIKHDISTSETELTQETEHKLNIEQQLKEAKSVKQIIVSALYPVLCLFLIASLFSESSSDASMIAIILALSIPIDLFILLPVFIIRRARLLKKRKNEFEQCQQNIDNIKNRLSELSNELVMFRNIPAEYSTSESVLSFLYEAVASGRAFTIGQAINLYEEVKHRKRMETLAEEQLKVTQANSLAFNNFNNDNENKNILKLLAFGGVSLLAASLFGGNDDDDDDDDN